MCLNILHLSDLHISIKTDVANLAAKIHNASFRNKMNLSPDAIIVTGDIFNATDFSSDDYRLAIDKAICFFECISKHFYIDNFCECLFFVPGNHEIYRESVKNNKPEEQLCRYSEFLATIYGEQWSGLTANIYDKKELCFVKHFKDKKTILVGLTSPRYEKSKKETAPDNCIETARIGNTQISTIHRQIQNIEGYESNRVIACLHNNTYNTVERNQTENVDVTCVQDNDLLLSVLNTYKCSLILHGHKHQLKNRRINLTQNIKEGDNLCTVIGGGTLKELSSDSFNYLEIYDTNNNLDLVCKEFRDESGVFMLSDHFSVPIQEDRRRFSRIEDAVLNDPHLSTDYEQLRTADTVYDRKLIDAFDTTLCIFKDISDNFFRSASGINLLQIVLGAIHYRSNLTDTAFLEKSKRFIKKATDTIGVSNLAFQMLDSSDIWTLCDKYEEYQKQINGSEHKKVFIFLTLSIYLTNFFLTVKYRPGEFFDKYIKQKANYELNAADIKTETSGNTIKFAVNDEHRALEITVRCSTANAHRVISLIIKEFELILSKFEEDFASVGFRVYYALPKLMKLDFDEEKLESYEFKAYIPRLIPLLAGRNIYDEPEAFTRELIQNSIDAIKVRAKHDGNEDYSGVEIELEIKQDSNSNLSYFKITDTGTGMNRYVLERYLTTIGRSFYTSTDFHNLGIKYSPISQFGIGFLSCFMLGKHVEVEATHHLNPDETFYLDIPNYDGCFFIEAKKVQNSNPGSSIKVWEDANLKKTPDNEFNIKKIKSYIKKIVCDIPFSITLNGEDFIPKYNYYNELKRQTARYNILFFIPIASDPDNSENVFIKIPPDCTPCSTVTRTTLASDRRNKSENRLISESRNENNVIRSEHGIYFFKKDNSLFARSEKIVMNNGILIRESSAVNEISLGVHSFLDIVFNLPSHALELEVSRDKLKHLKGTSSTFWDSLKLQLKWQVDAYLKTKHAESLEYILWCLLDSETFGLSKINIEIEEKSINIKIKDIGEYSPVKEFFDFYRLVEKIDKYY